MRVQASALFRRNTLDASETGPLSIPVISRGRASPDRLMLSRLRAFVDDLRRDGVDTTQHDHLGRNTACGRGP